MKGELRHTGSEYGASVQQPGSRTTSILPLPSPRETRVSSESQTQGPLQGPHYMASDSCARFISTVISNRGQPNTLGIFPLLFVFPITGPSRCQVDNVGDIWDILGMLMLRKKWILKCTLEKVCGSRIS